MGHWRTATLSAVCVLLLVILLLNSEDEVKTEVPRPYPLRDRVEVNPSKFGRRDVSGNTTQPPPEEAEEAELTLEDWMRSKEEGYERDRARIAKVCKKYGDKLKTDPAEGSKNFMVDRKHKWAYCRHGKVCEIV